MKKFFATAGLIYFITTGSVLADGFGINVTRVIFKGNSTNSTVTVRNTSSNEIYIVQARMSKTVDGFESTPFAITPPIFRLDPESTNSLRIQIGSRDTLPQDRESVFYLNARAIPASVQKGLGNDADRISGTAQFGIGSIIKLFYRPMGLPGSADSAQRSLTFRVGADGIRVKNNSAFHVSFASLTLGGESLLKRNTPAMLAPYSEYVYAAGNRHGKVVWSTINDFGGINEYTANL